ncbi:riboflavin-specific deaminase-like protein [Kushneria sinocarnis]|uniref:Riboflavin-specific deaminase-like protein n=1 Tax=Kushneria sinocarnis TaxID=595502 RepID=A0A420WV35_9GAMM|nr:RibD family protein [Kushneria sinocarnis]RKR02418.1 riboflavin-specific deaminase-like protein [Kushneria sinocarnis]
MSFFPLSEDRAWQTLREAAMADWAGTSCWTSAESGITLHAGGAWHYAGQTDEPARRLLDCLAPCVCAPSPFTLAQLGQSIDGRIATVSGASHYVTGQQGLIHLHRLRALVDAVVVGAGTVAADDPRLTVRHVAGRNPLRVVLDPRARLSARHRLFRDGDAPVLYLTGQRPPAGLGSHVEVATVQLDSEGVAPAEVLARLHERHCQRVLVEGGGITISRFLAAGLLDRLHAVVAPMLIGSGRPSLTLPEIDTLDEAHRPPCRVHQLDEDVLFDLVLKAQDGRQ